MPPNADEVFAGSNPAATIRQVAEGVCMQWTDFDSGRAIGQIGTESGVIIRDCAHPLGARITLETGGVTPYAITCGIYGYMVHTRFFSAESEAHREFDLMAAALDSILQAFEDDDDDLDDPAARFIERFP